MAVWKVDDILSSSNRGKPQPLATQIVQDMTHALCVKSEENTLQIALATDKGLRYFHMVGESSIVQIKQ